MDLKNLNAITNRIRKQIHRLIYDKHPLDNDRILFSDEPAAVAYYCLLFRQMYPDAESTEKKHALYDLFSLSCTHNMKDLDGYTTKRLIIASKILKQTIKQITSQEGYESEEVEIPKSFTENLGVSKEQ